MADIHLLTPGDDLRHCTVVCGARLPELGTWDRRAATCPACLTPPPVRVRSGLTEKA